MPIPISLKEALFRLTDNDPVEVWVEAIPNNGTTVVQKEARSWCIERLTRAAQVLETGPSGQARDMGINVITIGGQRPGHIGLINVFFQTKPECRLTAEQLREHEARGASLDVFSNPSTAQPV